MRYELFIIAVDLHLELEEPDRYIYLYLVPGEDSSLAHTVEQLQSLVSAPLTRVTPGELCLHTSLELLEEMKRRGYTRTLMMPGTISCLPQEVRARVFTMTPLGMFFDNDGEHVTYAPLVGLVRQPMPASCIAVLILLGPLWSDEPHFDERMRDSLVAAFRARRLEPMVLERPENQLVLDTISDLSAQYQCVFVYLLAHGNRDGVSLQGGQAPLLRYEEIVHVAFPPDHPRDEVGQLTILVSQACLTAALQDGPLSAPLQFFSSPRRGAVLFATVPGHTTAMDSFLPIFAKAMRDENVRTVRDLFATCVAIMNFVERADGDRGSYHQTPICIDWGGCALQLPNLLPSESPDNADTPPTDAFPIESGTTSTKSAPSLTLLQGDSPRVTTSRDTDVSPQPALSPMSIDILSSSGGTTTGDGSIAWAEQSFRSDSLLRSGSKNSVE